LGGSHEAELTTNARGQQAEMNRRRSGGAQEKSLAKQFARAKGLTQMLDKREKTRELIAIFEAAVPFDVALCPT
jgi:hypothetical protein